MRTQTEGERRSLGNLARSSSLPLWGGTPWSLCRWGRSLYPCIPSKRIEQCPRSRLLVSPTVHLQGPPVLGCHTGPYVPMSHASNRAPRRCRFIQHIISALSLVHQHGLLNCAARIQQKYSLARALTLTLFEPSQSPPPDSAAPSLSPSPSLSPCVCLLNRAARIPRPQSLSPFLSLHSPPPRILRRPHSRCHPHHVCASAASSGCPHCWF